MNKKKKILYATEIELPFMKSLVNYYNQLISISSFYFVTSNFRIPNLIPFPPNWINYNSLQRYCFRIIYKFQKYFIYPTIFHLKSKSFDCVHILDQGYAFLLKNCKIPSVITCHDIINIEQNIYPNSKQKNRSVYKNLKYASKIICVSEYTKIKIQEHFPCIPKSKFSVIYHFIPNHIFEIKDNNVLDSIKQKLKISKEYKIILHVGHNGKVKNVDTIIDVLSNFKLAYPEIPFIFLKVGSLLTDKQIVAAKKNNIYSNILQQGAVSDEKLNILYNLTDVLFFPSLSEGFGYPLIEAMKTNCFVIASNTGSIPEVVGDAGLFANPFDIKTFSKYLHLVFTDKKLQSKLNNKMRKQLLKYEKNTFEIQLINTYNELIYN